jgi:diaminopimelate decarboxylase
MMAAHLALGAMESPLSVRDGRLYIEELACTELAARFGTPLYVMSETRLRTNVRCLSAALAAGWPLGEARLLPSIKANLALLADITGISCTFDVIAPAVAVPRLTPGEVIAFLKTGAYQEASAANFNGLPRPATVLVRGATAEVVKRRETIEDVLGRDIVPERLRSAGAA